MQADIVIIGAGAAGLAAAIFAGEAARDAGLQIVVVDGVKKPGAKILVSGGGRCNVTNLEVTPDDFNGGSKTIIRNVLRAFDNKRTLEWMNSLGVELKLEETGKYFPVTDKARTVLDALMTRMTELGVKLVTDCRIVDIQHNAEGNGYKLLQATGEPISAKALIVAMGGLSLPKSGSDGYGLKLAKKLGHTVVPTTPALVPLLLEPSEKPGGRFADWSGITLEARLQLHEGSGKVLTAHSGSLLFTHFGISGPTALDISRHWLRRRLENPGEPARLSVAFGNFTNKQAADQWLIAEAKANPKRFLSTVLLEKVPERIAKAFAGEPVTIGALGRERRLEVAALLAGTELPVVGERGYSFAETTAGGVSLADITHSTMESRRCERLYFCGEMLDVDGRIGGFNFQWAWASGYIAGRAAVRSLTV